MEGFQNSIKPVADPGMVWTLGMDPIIDGGSLIIE
jgi:hypothetical protein